MLPLICATFAAALSLPSAGESTRDPASEPGRETIGLVLAGGSARGIAHAGVIQAMEELKVPVYAVAGTSKGALVGGLYASGKNATEMHRVIQTIDWDDGFENRVDRDDLPQRRKGDGYDHPTDFSLTFRNGKIAAPLVPNPGPAGAPDDQGVNEGCGA